MALTKVSNAAVVNFVWAEMLAKCTCNMNWRVIEISVHDLAVDSMELNICQRYAEVG